MSLSHLAHELMVFRQNRDLVEPSRVHLLSRCQAWIDAADPCWKNESLLADQLAWLLANRFKAASHIVAAISIGNGAGMTVEGSCSHLHTAGC